MITGIHSIIFTKDAAGVRAFFKDVLEFDWVDAGDGWLIFALPPAELGVHPSDETTSHELQLMCDDVTETRQELEDKGVEFTRPIEDVGWGLETTLRLPDGEEMWLYEPRHERAVNLKR
jgi:hypothetical protein